MLGDSIYELFSVSVFRMFCTLFNYNISSTRANKLRSYKLIEVFLKFSVMILGSVAIWVPKGAFLQTYTDCQPTTKHTLALLVNIETH